MRTSLKILGSKFHFAFFLLVLVWPLRKQDVSRQFPDWFILKNSHWCLWIHIWDTSLFFFNFFNFSDAIIIVTSYLYNTDFVHKMTNHWRWKKKNFVHNKGSLGTKWKQQSSDHGHIQLWELLKIPGYLLIVTLFVVSWLQNRIDLEFLGNVINYICYHICCSIFSLQFSCVFSVPRSFVCESLLLCISMVQIGRAHVWTPVTL